MRRISKLIFIFTIVVSSVLSFNVKGFAANAQYRTVEYSVHKQDAGWLSYVKNGSTAGSTGQVKHLEAIKIKTYSDPPMTNPPSFLPDAKLSYQVHVQNLGWLDYVSEGKQAGTVGRNLPIEAIKIKIGNKDISGHTNIKYRVHVRNIGWMAWVKNGEMAGTTGRALPIEAIQIKFEND